MLSGALTYNENLHFISKITDLEFQGQIIKLPIAHHQGNYTGIGNEEIIMKYKNNENGSDDRIAGIYNRENKIIGMMPHPERAVFDELGLTDGRKVFEFIKNEI